VRIVGWGNDATKLLLVQPTQTDQLPTEATPDASHIPQQDNRKQITKEPAGVRDTFSCQGRGNTHEGEPAQLFLEPLSVSRAKCRKGSGVDAEGYPKQRACGEGLGDQRRG